MLVFKVITVWAAARGGPEATPDLDILLPHVRFPLMTLEELDVRQGRRSRGRVTCLRLSWSSILCPK